MKTEIIILSGFLGSGKTTLLKNLLLLERARKRKTAVLMNEFGNISIDSEIIGDEVPLKELLGGCICCTIQEKLEGQIQGLLIEHKPEVIYIETTGAAHPVEVLDAIMSPLFANALIVKGIVTVLDGQRWLNRKSLSPQLQQLVLEQVRHADLILLNKSDELTEMEQMQVTVGIQSINPHSEVIMTIYSKIGTKQMNKLALKKKEFTESSHAVIDLNLSSFVYQFKDVINQTDFEAFLKNLPDSIYRIKGYVKFPTSKLPYLFQFSYGMPLYLSEEMNLPLNLVFIGENVNWKHIHELLVELEHKLH
jgi:G3E family GTPase